MKAPLGAGTVAPNCVPVAKLLVVPVYQSLALEIFEAGVVVPVVARLKLVTVKDTVATVTVIPITSLLVVFANTFEVFAWVVVQLTWP